MDEYNQKQFLKLNKAIDIQYRKVYQYKNSNFYKYKYHSHVMQYMILSKLKLGFWGKIINKNRFVFTNEYIKFRYFWSRNW